MAAWSHTTYWDNQMYQRYRNYVSEEAPKYRGRQHIDCADLSTLFLILFSADQGLPVTLKDMGWRRYISKGQRQTPDELNGKRWTNQTEYLAAVHERITTESLWERNLEVNRNGPQPGDLMIGYDGGDLHHTALVFRVYSPGASHPRANDRSIPDFPEDEERAVRERFTEYFRSRMPDGDIHFDYLNYRSRRKNLAELIYFAGKEEMVRNGFEFRKWKPGVIDNWTDWDGYGDPIRVNLTPGSAGVPPAKSGQDVRASRFQP